VENRRRVVTYLDTDEMLMAIATDRLLLVALNLSIWKLVSQMTQEVNISMPVGGPQVLASV